MEISASCAVVMDAGSKTVLYGKAEGEKRSIASITKIMTALLAVESGKLDSLVKITPEMLGAEGSSLGLKENDTITLRDLVTGMMLTSDNDSANAAAYFLAGGIKEFAGMMNERAAKIGMRDTLFVTPSGLDEGDHHSTAYDMALLTAQAVENEIFSSIVSMKSAEITISSKPVTVYNHNRLLSLDKDIFGVKTGFTKKAGRTLVSAKKYNGNIIIAFTLNAPDDWNDHLKLYDECTGRYSLNRAEGTVNIPVAGGQTQNLTASYSKDFCTLEQTVCVLYYYPFVYAPVAKGEKIGTVCVYSNNKLIERLPITADEDIEYYVGQK